MDPGLGYGAVQEPIAEFDLSLTGDGLPDAAMKAQLNSILTNDPVKKDCEFLGWYADSDLTIPVGDDYQGIGWDESENEYEIYAKWEELPTQAYAKLNETEGMLTFFRSSETYTDGQVIGDDTYYTGIETTQYETWRDVPWYANKNVTRVIFEDKVSPLSTDQWFAYMDNLEGIESLGNLDTSNVTDMYCMFAGPNKLQYLDLGGFDTTKVKDMSYMFENCSSLGYLDLTTFDTSSAEDMSGMFAGCTGITELSIQGFDTTGAKTEGMFDNVSNLEMIQLGHKSLIPEDANLTIHEWQNRDIGDQKAYDLLSEYDGSTTGWYYQGSNTIQISGVDSAYTYTGKQIKPVPVVKAGDRTLEENFDYTVSYGDNVNAGTGTVTIEGRNEWSGAKVMTFKINKAQQSVTVGSSTYTRTFGDKAFGLGAKTNGDGALKYSSNNTKVAAVSTAGKVTIKGAGTATITVYAAEGKNYKKSAAKTVTVKVNKAKNTMTAKGKTVKVRYSVLKKKNRTILRKNAITIKNKKGTLSFTKAKGNGKITVAKKTGKITVRKGLKKGKYTVKIKVRASGNANYKAKAKTVTVIITVK